MAILQNSIVKGAGAAIPAASDFFTKIRRWLMVIVMVSVPLFFSGLTAQGLMFDKQMLFAGLTLVLFILWIVGGAMAGRLNVRRTPIDIFVLAAFLILLASALFSLSHATSFLGAFGAPTVGVFGAVAALLFFFVGVSTVRTVEWATLLSRIFLAGGTLALLLALLQSLGVFLIPLAGFNQPAVNTIGSPLTVALLAATLFPLALTYFSLSQSLVGKILNGLATVVALLTLLTFNYVAAWMLLLIGTAILFLFWTGRKVQRAGGVIVFLVIAFALGIFSLAARGLNLPIGLTPQLPIQVSLSQGTSWTVAKNALASRFALGTGPGTYQLAFTRYRPPEFNSSLLWNIRFSEPASFFLELLTTTGILGGLAFLVLIGSVLYLGLRWFLKAQNGAQVAAGAGVFAALTALAAAAFLTELNTTLLLSGLILTVIFLALIAIDWPAIFFERKLFLKVSTEPSLALSATMLGAIAIVALTFTFLTRIFAADVLAANALKGPDASAAVNTLARSAQLAPWRDTYLANIAQLSLVALQREAAKAKPDAQVVQNAVSNAIRSAAALTNSAGQSAASWQVQGLVYQRVSVYVTNPLDALARAKEAYLKVTEREPTNPAAYVALAQIARQTYLALSEKERAPQQLQEGKDYLAKALALKKDYADIYFEQGLIAEIEGDNDAAIAALVKAANISATADVRLNLARLLYNRGISPGAQEDDLKNAQVILEGLVKTAPQFSDARFALAILYERQGQNQDAIDQLTVLKGQLLAGPSKEAVIQRLERLSGEGSSAAEPIPPLAEEGEVEKAPLPSEP